MALIDCPECSKEISDKASACPHCGCPVTQESLSEESILKCPDFPNDLSIGGAIGFIFVKGKFIKNENIHSQIPEGAVHVFFHEKGIKISSGSFFLSHIMDIHVSQLIGISETSESELIQQNKSVVGRAAVGALLFGPFGAIVGGLSGLNTSKTMCKNMLIISFWDTITKEPKSIIIRSEQPLGPIVQISKAKYEKI